MVTFPNIQAIVATDLSGYICDGDSNLITRYSDELTQKLDRRILTEYVSNWREGGDALFVVGNNTWEAMGGKLRGIIGSYVIVSHEDHCTYMNERIEYTNSSSLFNYCAELSIRRDLQDVIVLGGRSVYYAFRGHYSSVVHCTVKTNKATSGKKVLVKPDGHEVDLACLMNPGKTHLHVPIDNETYSVKINSLGVTV